MHYGYYSDIAPDALSGSVQSGDIGPGAVLSGNIGSGQLGGYFHFAQTVQIPNFLSASGQIETHAGLISFGGIAIEAGTFQAKSGIALDGSESGFITAVYLGSGSVLSGSIGSGQTQIFDAMATVEAINAMHAVAIDSGGCLVQAMAGSGLRIPAIGIVTTSGVSGAVLNYYSDGRYMHPGGGSNWSGQAGKHLYVGSGGEIVAQGLLVSGQRWQRLGVAVSGGIIVLPDLTITSGALAANGTNY